MSTSDKALRRGIAPDIDAQSLATLAARTVQVIWGHDSYCNDSRVHSCRDETDKNTRSVTLLHDSSATLLSDSALLHNEDNSESLILGQRLTVRERSCVA